MKLTVLVLAVVHASGACGSSKPSGSAKGPPKPFEPNAALPTECKGSEDCALIQACCGCSAGGKQIAIRADAVASFEASRETRCAGQMCAQMISTDPSCDAEAVCGQNGRCIVTPHLQSN
jgi:hypothetical protein